MLCHGHEFLQQHEAKGMNTKAILGWEDAQCAKCLHVSMRISIPSSGFIFKKPVATAVTCNPRGRSMGIYGDY